MADSDTPNLDKLCKQCADLNLKPGATVKACKQILKEAREKARQKAAEEKAKQEKAKQEKAKQEKAKQEKAKQKATAAKEQQAKVKRKRAQQKEEQRKEEERENIHDFFKETYGQDNTRLDMWQQLCADLEVEIGPSITQCKKHIKSVYVNIWEYVRASQTDTKAPRYTSMADFRKSIKRTGTYSLGDAKKNEFLKSMLREIYFHHARA